MHLDDFELLAGERAGLVQDFVRDIHLADVVQVGAEADGRDFVIVQPQLGRHGDGVLSHALAVAEGVAVAGLDRLAPIFHDVEVGPLEFGDLAADVDELAARVEPSEKTVRRVEQRERFLVSAHGLIQYREISRRLRLVQHGIGTVRKLDGGAKP